MAEKESLIRGPLKPALESQSIGHLLTQQTKKYPARTAVVFPESGVRYTYQELSTKVKTVSLALLAYGVQSGDRLGIFAGNCEQYLEIFLAATRIGAITVLLNITYSAVECLNVMRSTGCSLLFISTHIGKRDMQTCLEALFAARNENDLPQLKNVVLLNATTLVPDDFERYEKFIARAPMLSESILYDMEQQVQSDHVATFQFTSGTTGAPKIAMLTHSNVINNGRLIGQELFLSETDVICCPYPLFHISGLVIGLLASLTHGAAVVYPSATFDPTAVLRAAIKEGCTGLHGTPAIFIALLEQYSRHDRSELSHLRTGLIGGAPIAAALVKDIQRTFGLADLMVAYGMTETSPISFMCRASHQPDAGAVIHRKILPHTSAKIVNSSGQTVRRGSCGELCIAGYLVQTGYYQNPEKTHEALKVDADGTVWMYTGDQAFIDEQGQCIITGRIKDIIIRGAENIYPAETEERLNAHRAISQSCVVGVRHDTLGEEVAAFLQPAVEYEGAHPSDGEIVEWVRLTLGAQKAPTQIFWLGEGHLPATFPVTESGKIKRVDLAKLGDQLTSSVRLRPGSLRLI